MKLRMTIEAIVDFTNPKKPKGTCTAEYDGRTYTIEGEFDFEGLDHHLAELGCVNAMIDKLQNHIITNNLYSTPTLRE